MNGSRPKITLQEVKEVARQIVERFHPQKVILFGSYAKGNPTRDSDADLLVVMETEENPLHVAGLISASIDHPFPLDIIVKRPSELAASLAENAIFETEVVTKGLTLYEAEDERVD